MPLLAALALPLAVRGETLPSAQPATVAIEAQSSQTATTDTVNTAPEANVAPAATAPANSTTDTGTALANSATPSSTPAVSTTVSDTAQSPAAAPATASSIKEASPLTKEAQTREIQENLSAPNDPASSLLSPAWGGTAASAPRAATIPEGQTIADQRLQRIYDSQLEFFAQLEANPDMAESLRDQRAQNLISQYQSLLLDNPNYVYGYVMYGKLLRQVGQRELANKAFVKANALDPDIAVVKQQIGNYLSEEGDYDLALPYFLAAIRLAPETAVYHYQLGQLLHTYRSEFLANGKLSAPVLDKQLQEAFAHAARLDPSTRVYALRRAESFFDIAEPDWQQALEQWNALEASATDEREKQMILLQKCRVLIALDQLAQAQSALLTITDPALQPAREILYAMLADAKPDTPLPTADSLMN